MNIVLAVGVGAIFIFALYKTISRSRKGSACCGEHEGSIKRIGPADRNKSHYPYEASADIMGMTCDNCAARVENALNKIDGIWASVSIDSKKAKILSKEPLDVHSIKDAVIEEGYGIDNIEIKR
ncbi:MAG: heavy-metal-associated domain-containing protein [Faecalicoccus sp.]|nr:heavy-metal-associated domain-containing protein [Faecalicoccus sp.]